MPALDRRLARDRLGLARRAPARGAGQCAGRRRSLAGIHAALAAACLVSGLPSGASPKADPISASSGDDTAASATEEIIVHGHKPLRTLRLEVQQARERVYELLNRYNTDDRFDIQCRRERRPGSHIKERVCRAVYVDEATHRAGSRVAQSLQAACPQGLDKCDAAFGDAEAVFNNATAIFQDEYRAIHELNPEFVWQMRQLVLSVPEITVAFAEYLDKEQEYREARQRRGL